MGCFELSRARGGVRSEVAGEGRRGTNATAAAVCLVVGACGVLVPAGMALPLLLPHRALQPVL